MPYTVMDYAKLRDEGYYYDLNEAGRFEKLFGDTYIGQHPTGRQNRYMVLVYNGTLVYTRDYPSGRSVGQRIQGLGGSIVGEFIN